MVFTLLHVTDPFLAWSDVLKSVSLMSPVCPFSPVWSVSPSSSFWSLLCKLKTQAGAHARKWNEWTQFRPKPSIFVRRWCHGCFILTFAMFYPRPSVRSTRNWRKKYEHIKGSFWPCWLLKNSQICLMRARAKLITGRNGLGIKVPDWVFPWHQQNRCPRSNTRKSTIMIQ